jgi:hypothetical protein
MSFIYVRRVTIIWILDETVGLYHQANERKLLAKLNQQRYSVLLL